MRSPKLLQGLVIVVLQVQACVVGFLAAVAAILFGLLADGDFNIHQGFLLCAGSVITASLASLLLGKWYIK